MSDPGEDSQTTAARELFEELGVADAVEWLGCLPEFYVYVSNIRRDAVDRAYNRAANWLPTRAEVNAVIELPLSVLVDRTCIGEINVRCGPMTLNAPCYEFDGGPRFGERRR